jgi:hypothetical protein
MQGIGQALFNLEHLEGALSPLLLRKREKKES